MLRARYILLFVICLLLFSCENNKTTSEDYGDIMNSPAGLTLTQGEHEQGWGKSECTLCHNLYNIHADDSAEDFDMAAVRRQVEQQGVASCATCHGTNGVE